VGGLRSRRQPPSTRRKAVGNACWQRRAPTRWTPGGDRRWAADTRPRARAWRADERRGRGEVTAQRDVWPPAGSTDEGEPLRSRPLSSLPGSAPGRPWSSSVSCPAGSHGRASGAGAFTPCLSPCRVGRANPRPTDGPGREVTAPAVPGLAARGLRRTATNLAAPVRNMRLCSLPWAGWRWRTRSWSRCTAPGGSESAGLWMCTQRGGVRRPPAGNRC